MNPVDRIISELGLLPHPEGGHYARTYVSGTTVSGNPSSRASCSAIYYLLKRGEISRFHRVDAEELWHFYMGAPLELTIVQGQSSYRAVLGTDLENGQRPQILIPRWAWQSAKTLGEFTLVGATVSPEFQFDGFEMAPVDFDPERG